MRNFLLETELKKMKMLMGYDPQETLTENEIPSLDKVGNTWTGTLDMTNASAFGKFKNEGSFSEAGKIVYIEAASSAIGYEDITVSTSKQETSTTGDTETKVPVSIDIDVDATEPFEFDSLKLVSGGTEAITKFANEILTGVEEDYGPDVKEKYYTWLKSKPITIRAYSSIDASSNFPDGGTVAECAQYGTGKGPRKTYNKCLSQKRAEVIVSELKKKGGILAELTYDPVGMGETNKFSKIVWADGNKTFGPKPSKSEDQKNPNGTAKTQPDRRFEIIVPTFTLSDPQPNPDDDKSNNSNIDLPGNRAMCFKWAVVLGVATEENISYGKEKEGRNGILVDDRNRPINVNLKTQAPQSLMSQKGICWDSEVMGCDGQKGNFIWCKNQWPLVWDLSSDLGITGDYKIPCRKEAGGSRMFFDGKVLEDKLGEDYQKYFYFDTDDKNPEVTISTSGIELNFEKQNIYFGPWMTPQKNLDPTNSVFKITPYKFKVTKAGTGGENDDIQIVGLSKISFSLSKNPNL
jgi:hypothetical protein